MTMADREILLVLFSSPPTGSTGVPHDVKILGLRVVFQAPAGSYFV